LHAGFKGALMMMMMMKGLGHKNSYQAKVKASEVHAQGEGSIISQQIKIIYLFEFSSADP